MTAKKTTDKKDGVKLRLKWVRSAICTPVKHKRVVRGLGFTRLNQVIDDLKGVTLVSANSAEGKKEVRTSGGNLASAKNVGKVVAERAKAKGITKVVFDRGGYIYHGRVKALADAAREAGLQF